MRVHIGYTPELKTADVDQQQQTHLGRTLETKARGLAGIKGYITNIDNPTPEIVIGAYHRRNEQSSRKSKHDHSARSITTNASPSTPHLNIVFVALAVTRLIEDRTGWSIKRFVRTARRYRTVDIAPANAPSPPKTHYPTTSATPSPSHA